MKKALGFILEDVQKRPKKYLLHVCIWIIVWFAIRYFSIPTLVKDNKHVCLHASIEVFIESIAIFYLLGSVVFFKYLYNRKFVYLLAWILALFQVVYIVNYFEFSYLATISDSVRTNQPLYVTRAWKNYYEPNHWMSCFTSFTMAYLTYAWSFFYVTPLLAIKVMRDIIDARLQNLKLERDRLELERDNLYLQKRSVELQREHLQLQKDNLTLEVGYLKSQIDPHFLFNILHVIYGRTMDTDDVSSEIVMKLAHLMRYNLYESNRQTVTLSEEVQYIESYLDLEITRFDDRVKVSFEKEGQQTDYLIAPLLLISLVENAFKHGTTSDLKSPFVSISLSMGEHTLNFSVRNSLSKNVMPSAHRSKSSRGVGLENTRKRLALLYPGLHTFELLENDIEFCVSLSIVLTRAKTI